MTNSITLPQFNDPKIRASLQTLRVRGQEWLNSLGQFNEDLKNLEDLLKAYCTPCFEVNLAVKNGVLQLGAAPETLRWDSSGRMLFYKLGDEGIENPLRRTDAFLRRRAQNEGWLQLVVEEACDELQKSLEHFEKSDD